MKKLIKQLSSQKQNREEKEVVEMYVENGIYTVQYKFITMNNFKVDISTNNIRNAELNFIKLALFILS